MALELTWASDACRAASALPISTNSVHISSCGADLRTLWIGRRLSYFTASCWNGALRMKSAWPGLSRQRACFGRHRLQILTKPSVMKPSSYFWTVTLSLLFWPSSKAAVRYDSSNCAPLFDLASGSCTFPRSWFAWPWHHWICHFFCCYVLLWSGSSASKECSRYRAENL